MHFALGFLFGSITFFLWGIADYFAALLSRRFGVQAILLRVQFAGLVVAWIIGLILYQKEFVFLFPVKFIFQIGVVSVAFAASYLVFYKGLAEGLVAVVSPISACWSLITVLWGVLVWREKLTLHGLAGIGLILTGVVLTSLEVKNLFKLSRTQLAKGALEGMGAMLCWGVSLTFIIPFVREYGWYYPVFWMRLWSVVFTVLFFKLFPSYLKKSNTEALRWGPFILVAICDIVAIFSFGEGSRVSLASVVAPIASCFPIVTILMAVSLLKERLSHSQKVGVALSLTGIILISV